MIRDLAPGKPTYFFLPELPRSLACAYHPKAVQVEFASNGWIRRMLGSCFADEAALLRYLRQRVGLYGPFTAPHATDDRVRTITDWYQFATVLDDIAATSTTRPQDSDHMAELHRDILASFTDTATPKHPVGHAAHDLWQRLRPGMTTRQRTRLAATLTDFLDAIQRELRLSRDGDIPDYETCMRMRANSRGWPFVQLLTEYAVNVDMTSYVDDVEFIDLHHHALRHLLLINDLASFRKEFVHNEPTVTSVLSLWVHGRTTLQEVITQICELVAHHKRCYDDARRQILNALPNPDKRVKTYLAELDNVLAGHQDFHYMTPRYWGDQSVWDGTTSGWVDLTTDTGRLLPHTPEVTP